jgi:tetratricopeptide (TPR) repeat protein
MASTLRNVILLLGLCLGLTLIVIGLVAPRLAGVLEPYFPQQSFHRMTGTANPYAKANQLDQQGAKYFFAGDSQRALPLMLSSLEEYRRVAKLNHDDLTKDAYYADELQHTGKIYLGLKQPEKAVPFYEEALRIYKPWGNSPAVMTHEAIEDYATVLTQLGKREQASAMKAQFEETGQVVLPSEALN